MSWVLWALAAFASGSIPFGLLIARAKGVDIRKVGSGNIGATNVGRALGRPYFFLCFGLDLLKGLLPTLGYGLAMSLVGGEGVGSGALWGWLGVMVCPVLGHMFSPFVGFRGGKGVATGLGGLLGVFPLLSIAGVASLVLWLVSVKVTRYVGVSSSLAAAALPVWVAAGVSVGWVGGWGESWPALVVTGVLGLLVVLKHSGNIRRTLAGTEPKVGGGQGGASESVGDAQ